MTKRLKDELETLSKWRTAIRNLPKEDAQPLPKTLTRPPRSLQEEYDLLAANKELREENAELKSLIDKFLIEWDDEQGDRCLLDDAVDALKDIRKAKP